MPFWDDFLDQLDIQPRRRISGQPIPPGGPYPGGMAGSSYGGRSDIFDQITGIIGANNRSRGLYGGDWRSDPNASRGLSGGLSMKPMGGLGGAVGSGLAAQIRPPGSDIEDILARLEELQNPSNYMGSEGDLESQARAAAAAQYDPVIGELQRAMESARNRGNRNKLELGRMYSALSGSIQGEIPGIQKQYATDKKSAQKFSSDLQNQIKQQYNTSAAEQEDMYKRLGIEAAASETLPQQQRDRDYFVNQAATQGQAEQAALGQEEAGTVDYTREGGQIARFEGTNRQADLMAELQDLLSEYEGKIGENRAAKEQAYVAGLGQLRSQAQQSAYDMADRAAKNYLAQIQLGRDLRADEYKYGGGGAKEVTSIKSPADIPGRVLSLGLNQAQARGINDVMMTMLNRDPSILTGREGLGGNTIPKEGLAQRIVEEGRRRHFSQQALNALMTVALEYFGRR